MWGQFPARHLFASEAMEEKYEEDREHEKEEEGNVWFVILSLVGRCKLDPRGLKAPGFKRST